MVAKTQTRNSFPLGLVHYIDFNIPFGCRFCVFLRPVYGRFHDFHCVDGKTKQCCGFIPFRSNGVPREEPEEQGGRFAFGTDKYAVPVFGKCVGINSGL